MRGFSIGQRTMDFTLNLMKSDGQIQLSTLQGKPTVVIVGSYTWGPIMGSVGDTSKWYESYKDKANFLLVYVEEAHPGNTVEGRQVFAHESDDRVELA
jgi:Iodothyronine deiodinase